MARGFRDVFDNKLCILPVSQHCQLTDSFRGTYERANAMIAPSASIMNGYNPIYNCNGCFKDSFLDQNLHIPMWNFISIFDFLLIKSLPQGIPQV